MFKIILSNKSKNFIEKLDKKDAEKILKKIYSIRYNPFRYLKKLQRDMLWRLRIGDYRAITDVVVSNNVIFVVRVGHRRNVY